MKAPARAHTEVYSADGKKKIGEITSGGFGPTFNKPLAMAYVETESSANDTQVTVNVRGKTIPAQVSKMPFVATDYFKV
jgi:aminomethyltransferase